MKSVSALVIAAICAFSATAHGQIVWGNVTAIQGDSDVSVNGTSIDALQALPSGNNGINKPAETVNGTLFNSDNLSLTDGVITYSGPLGGGSDGGQGLGLSTAYSSVLAGCVYVDDNPADYNPGTFPAIAPTGVITLDVTAGDTYQVQLWNAYLNGYRTTTFSVGSDSVTLAGSEYVIGTFTATSSTEVIDFNGVVSTDSSGVGEVNAVALRETPEPSTYAMLIVGLAFLGFRLRRVGRA